MSGILLPGQEKRPDQGAKIELPKGFTTRKKEDGAAAPAPDGNAPAQSGRPRRGKSGQPGADLRFPPRGAQVRCPSCGTQYVAPVFTIIDLGANPELRGPLLSGQVNMGVCPNCGAGGSLGAPLMVHDPDNTFLGVYVPMDSGRDDLTRQQAIGDLLQALLRHIPTSDRKGYLLQPSQYVDWQRFMEKMWEFEGVTPEMLRRQRDQSALLQRLLTLAGDKKALDLALERSAGLVDREFFSLLDQIVVMARGQANEEEIAQVLQLRDHLLETTPAGQEVRAQQQRVRDLIAKITPEMKREDLVKLVVDAWSADDGQQVVGTLAVAAGRLFDYQFLMALSERIGGTQGGEREKLEELRQFLLDVQEQMAARQQQAQQSDAQHAQELLQEVLQANDPAQSLRDRAEDIDEAFLAILAANLQQAEKAKATAAARRLRAVYEQAIAILQENMPADMRLLNQLLSAPDEATMRRLLKENRSLLTPEFIEALTPIEDEMRENGQAPLADRIKSLRGQIKLLI